ncbi:hypothetical protein [Nocardia sp.]|uniref:hypothetical protein n=1 Tax=Nocardia sp. TaxID=1821 RepID=UPI00338D3FC6
MPSGVRLVGSLDGGGGATVAFLGGQFVLDRAPPLSASLGADPLGEFAFGHDLGIRQHLYQGGVVLERQHATGRRDPVRQCCDLGGAGRLFVGHREPSLERVSCRFIGGDKVARTYV